MKRFSDIITYPGFRWFTKSENFFEKIFSRLAPRVLLVLILGVASSVCLSASGAGAPASASAGEDYDSRSLADSLHRIVEHYDLFVRQKEEKISRLKQIRAALTPNSEELFRINQQLIEEYRKFQADSAIAYARQNLELSRALADKTPRDANPLPKNDAKEITSLTELSMILSMTGRFREAESLLTDIDPASLIPGQKREYYEALKFFWEYYSISTNHDQTPPIAYKDSLLKYLPKDSYTYRVEQAVSHYPADSLRTEQEFQRLFDSIPVGTPEYAMLTNYFAWLNRGWGNRERAKQLYRLSAITDLHNATRETVSLQALASMEMEEGNLQEAYRFTSRTVDDIMLSGISFRAPEIYNFYSILSTALRDQEHKNQRSLIIFICVLGVGLIILAVLALLTYRQMKRIQLIKAELAENNRTLHQLNAQLNESNEKLNETNEKLNESNEKLSEQNDLLVESNTTKEHYITQFFDICFSYVSKMEKEQNLLYKLTVNRSFDQLTKRLQSDAVIKEEISSLYERFDAVFLRLYPSFVEAFNALLEPDERIVLKQDGILTRELRIYALLRLGIADSAKIASFLRCSMGTIYNYRTRMRNRAINRDTFEDDIMKIPAAHDL